MKRCLMLMMLALVLPGGGALGQDEESGAILPGRPDAEAGEDVLGETFESQSAGISLRVPGGMKLARRGVGEEIAQFVDEQRQWSLRISRRTLSQSRPLVAAESPDGQAHSVSETVMQQLLNEHPRAQVLREDAMTLGDGDDSKDVALLAARVTQGTQRHLFQQAIVQANPRVYYLISLSTPTAVPTDADESAAEDPNERAAVQAFTQTLETVKLSDLSALRADQDKRLLNTRQLYAAITPNKLKGMLVDEQWLRIQRDGVDIGYSYVIEELDDQNPRVPIVVAMRTRTQPEEGVTREAESWMRISPDRRHETWSTVEVMTRGEQVDHATVFGSSDLTVRRILDRRQPIGADEKDAKQAPVRQDEEYRLKATHVTKSVTAPTVERELPPFYLPQAVAHLLPRLVPLDRPQAYLFASYIPERREVMLRYVDVGEPENVRLADQLVRAVPVRERVGVEGSVTTHYLSPEGQYLGTVNHDAKIRILPTDADTLLTIWQDADLTRPQPQQEGQ